MKKVISMFLTLTMIFALTACGSKQQANENASEPSPTSVAESSEVTESVDETENTESTEAPNVQPESDAKTLVVYFSMPETTDPDNMTQEEDNSVVVIDGEVLGNTQYMAYVIQENTGADIFRIEPETPYPTRRRDMKRQKVCLHCFQNWQKKSMPRWGSFHWPG